MDMQNMSDSGQCYPLFTTDREVRRRKILEHISSTGESQEEQKLQASASGTVLAPALSIVPEEEEEATTLQVCEETWATRSLKEYSYKLVCCRNQLGIGMSNPGPR